MLLNSDRSRSLIVIYPFRVPLNDETQNRKHAVPSNFLKLLISFDLKAHNTAINQLSSLVHFQAEQSTSMKHSEFVLCRFHYNK